MGERARTITRFMLGFHRILVVIRADIKYSKNENLITIINKYCSLLRRENVIEFSEFQSEVIQCMEDSGEKLCFIEKALDLSEVNIVTDNVIEINRYLSVIDDTTLEILKYLKYKKFDRVYGLIDAIHCLPEALISRNFWNADDYWKGYIQPYREEWDKSFLCKREKKIRLML